MVTTESISARHYRILRKAYLRETKLIIIVIICNLYSLKAFYLYIIYDNNKCFLKNVLFLLQQRHLHQNHSKNQLTLTHSNSFANLIILKTNKTVTNTVYSCQSCYEFVQLYVQLFLIDICSQIINSVFKLLNVQLKIKPSSTHWSSRDQVLFQKEREDVCGQTSTDSLPHDQVKGFHACLSPDPFLHNCICSDLTWLSSFKLHGEHYLRK